MSVGRLAVVGAGRIGLSLAADLADTGLFSSITVVGRRPEPPGFLAAAEPSAGSTAVAYRPHSDPPGFPPDVLIFCVPDDRLASVASAWAELASASGCGSVRSEPASRPSTRIALHTSGLHPASMLEPLRLLGWRVGGWHPLVAIAAPRRGALAGVGVGLEGDPEAVALGERLAEALGARPLALRPEAKVHYHAGAVFASNFLVACLAVARRELSRAAREEAAPEHLLPLARSALENVALRGLAAGVTGPVARGDVGTVERHLAALDARTGALYRALASELLRELDGGEADDTRERLARLLQGEVSQPAR